MGEVVPRAVSSLTGIIIANAIPFGESARRARGAVYPGLFRMNCGAYRTSIDVQPQDKAESHRRCKRFSSTCPEDFCALTIIREEVRSSSWRSFWQLLLDSTGKTCPS